MTYDQLKAITENFHGKLVSIECVGNASFWGAIDGVGLADRIGPNGEPQDHDYLLIVHPRASAQTWIDPSDILSFEIEMTRA